METIFKLNLKIKFAEILQHMQLLNTLTLDQSLTDSQGEIGTLNLSILKEKQSTVVKVQLTVFILS